MMRVGEDLADKMAVFLIMGLIIGSLSSIPVDGEIRQPRELDLEMEGPRFSDEEPMSEDNISISVTLHNNESKTIDGLKVIFLIDAYEIGNVSQIELDAGQQKSIDITWEAEEGTHNIIAVVEYEGMKLAESSRELEVEPEPIGDLYSLVMALVVIISAVFAAIIFDSIKNYFKALR